MSEKPKVGDRITWPVYAYSGGRAFDALLFPAHVIEPFEYRRAGWVVGVFDGGVTVRPIGPTAGMGLAAYWSESNHPEQLTPVVLQNGTYRI